MRKLGAVILAGGASRRMGADKATLNWGGVRAIDRVAQLATAVGAESLIVAGGDYRLPFVADPYPRAGPCAGVLVGAAAISDQGCTHALVLAVDAPTILPEDLAPLVEAPLGAAYDGFPLPFSSPIARIPGEVRYDMPLFLLLELMQVARIAPTEPAARRLRGANTPSEKRDLAAEAGVPDRRAPNP